MKRILFLTSLATSIWANAQTDTTELLPVEVKTIRASATAPFAKTNLSKADIQKQNLGQDLPFVLNQTPSVVVNSDAGNGIGYTGIRIRGTDATRINVTVNGIPFNDPESGGTFFVNMPDIVSSASSIQVQRGVGTSSNGAGAFGGTINISTHEINLQPYFESNNSYGSFHSLKNTIKLGSGLLGNHFTADLRLSQIKSNGFIDRATSNLQSYYFSTAYLNDKSTIRFTTFSGKEKTYQAWYGITDADIKHHRTVNSAGTEKPGEPYDNETDNYKQDHYQLFFTQKLSPKFVFNTGLFYIKGKGYYEQYKANEAYADYGISNPVYSGVTITNTDLVRQLWLNNNFYGNVFSLQYSNQGTELTLGGSLSRYNGNHYGIVNWALNGLPGGKNTWYNHEAVKEDVNVYTKLQQSVTNNLRFFIDVQVRKVNYKIDGFRDNPGVNINERSNFFNPKTGFTYFNNNWTAFASYSMANKEPNRDDFEASVTEQPKPERLHDIEAGIERKNKTYSIGATAYFMKYKDQLVLTGKINDVGAYTRSNIDDSYRLGIELQGGATIYTWLKASGNLTLSRNKLKNFNEFIDDYDNGGQKLNTYTETDISFSPTVLGAATVTIMPVKKLSVDLLSKYVGKQYLDNTSNSSRRLNAFYTQDLRLSYSFSKNWVKNTELILQLNNAFNKKYEPNGYTFSYYYNNALTTENYYFPMAGTNWMVGVNVRL